MEPNNPERTKVEEQASRYRPTTIVSKYDEKDDSYWLWTSKKFEIGYNENRIVDVNLTSETKVKLTPGINIKFSYDVT